MRQWENNVRKVVPYVAGEQPNEEHMIKLNTNENPYPPSPSVYEMLKKIDIEELRLYPDSEATLLIETLAKYHGLNKKQVFVGVGSDDVLSLAFLTFFNSEKSILFPDITYSFYPVWANVYRISFETIKLNEKLEIEVGDYCKENGGIVIANPNAPTSIVLPLSSIESIIKNNQDVIVIIDEAYIDFGGESALSLIDKYDNLIVVRTYSKSRSMAGMRIGYAMANECLIHAMLDVKESVNSYTMSQISISLGMATIKDESYFREKIKQIVSVREETKERLEKIGFEVMPSSTNFLFVKHRNVHAKVIYENLRKNKIYVRYFNQLRIDNFLRITMGTKEQMEVVLETMEKCVTP